MFRTLKILRIEGEFGMKNEGRKKPQILGVGERLRSKNRRAEKEGLPGNPTEIFFE